MGERSVRARRGSSVREAVEEAARRLAAHGRRRSTPPRVRASASPKRSSCSRSTTTALSPMACRKAAQPARGGRFAATPEGDLSHRALQARGAGLTPGDYRDHGDATARAPAPLGAVFRAIRRGALPAGAGRRDPARSPARHSSARVLSRRDRAAYLDFLQWSSLASGPGLPATVAPVGARSRRAAARRPDHRRDG